MTGRRLSKPLFSVTSRLINKKYVLGEMDCFRVVYEWLREADSSIPSEFKGQTIFTYGDLYKKEPYHAKKLMMEFLEKYLVEISVHHSMAGDVLILQYKADPFFTAVDGGNGNIISAAPQVGVNVLSKSYYRVLRAFRCRKYCH